MATHLSESRTVPAPPEQAFETLLHDPPQELLVRRYGPIPPVRGVRDQSASWGSVGSSRQLVLADGGTMREELTSVDPPRSFGYRLTEVTGPFKPLVTSIDGLWSVHEAGTGCRITWSWTIHPRGRAGALAMPVVGRLWHGYARRGLEDIGDRLLR